jgi:hypothetical protein
MYLLPPYSEGGQSLQLDDISTGNAAISRAFLLDPGYYQLSYDYVSDTIFSSLKGNYCGATPSAANMSALSGTAAASTASYRGGSGPGVATALNTNTIGVFMSHAQMASTPIGGGALGSTTQFLNPDGTTSTTPTVSPSAISLTSYNAAQPNPLLDICGYAPSWTTRTRAIKILKPAYYWLTIAALGASDGQGGAIDNVKLTALGSPVMLNPPSSYVTIPVPGPQPGSTVGFNGFSIIDNPQYQ